MLHEDDINIYVKSEMSTNRVMKRNFLGFTYFKTSDKWNCMTPRKSKITLYNKCSNELIRKKRIIKPNLITFTKINQIIKGWINYFCIRRMKLFIEEFGEYQRHKIRIVIHKQWKKSSKI